MDQDQVHHIVIALIIIFSLGLTVVYYFVRYYFKTDHDDVELSPHLKDAKPLEVSDPEKIKSEVGLEEKKAEKTDEVVLADSSVESKIESKAKPILEPKTEPSIEDRVESTPRPQGEPLAQRKDLKEALKNTKSGFLGRIQNAFSGQEIIGEDDIETLEEILYTSDLGPSTVQRLVETVSAQISKESKSDFEALRLALKSEMERMLQDENSEDLEDFLKNNVSEAKPFVLMVVGVNGAGKTTTIGKLASKATHLGLKTLVVAGDTFRAAAEDQLKVWSERANVDIFNPDNTKDPSAVAYDGVNKAKNENYDVVIIDTAGRLHTQDNLMEELKKMKRVMKKVLDTAPHETFIVLDANSGQNALIQAKSFNEALDLSGVVLTKLDGSAKGGVALGLAYELGLKIKFIGVGEGIDDLRNFNTKEFVDSII